jgi:hypothetical protein
MAVGAQRLPIEALADAAKQVAAGSDLRAALAAVAAAAAEALDADLVAVRIVGDDGDFVARVFAPETSALAAEVAAPAGVPTGCRGVGLRGRAARRGAVRAAVLAVPARAGTDCRRSRSFGKSRSGRATRFAVLAAQVFRGAHARQGVHAAADFGGLRGSTSGEAPAPD